ncbi:MAG TPA: GNAT family N-acetyltransferase, partial [Acidimicrobiales bacterium]|nr:GNAT family N-acetyltransferase [Acidimicrobiales bacterium]
MAAAYDEALIELSEERGGRMLIATAAPGEPVEEALRALLSQPAAALFVGTFDEAVVGGAVVEALDTTVGRVACIRLLFVAEAARGVGVGERLMEEVT